MSEHDATGATTAPSTACWAFDGEGESALVGFDGPTAADAYVARQNAHQGRTRWMRLDSTTDIPDRKDGTPAILPEGCGISIAGFHSLDCARALEVAGALAHAASGRRRIVGQVIATPVEGDVDLEIEDTLGRVRSWRFARRDSRLMAARLATLAITCLPIVDGAKQ